jgi:N-acetylmuramoyl-L-alanine amidase
MPREMFTWWTAGAGTRSTSRKAAQSRTRKPRASPAGNPVLSHLAAGLCGAAVVALGAWIAWLASTVRGPSPDPDALLTPPSQYSWAQQPPAAFPIPPYARFLEGVKIVLDPGHVGQIDKGSGWKRGPTGLREAEVNLRVTQFLREFLQAAGAAVTLTREVDQSLGLEDHEDLRDRAEIANRLRADLLLSIHHNAASSASANYTSVFYHRSPDHSPASLCAARYLLTGLNDALRLEQHLGCALVSDLAIYKTDGFAVLRHARVPAVLVEGSFYSNPAEEQRLRDPLYNRREAYGLFLGLARWAQAGLPRVRLVEPADGRLRRGQAVVVALEDGLSGRGGLGSSALKILSDSLVVELDGQRLDYTVNWNRSELRFTPPASAAGRPARLYVDFATVFGQHVLHPWLELSAE